MDQALIRIPALIVDGKAVIKRAVGYYKKIYLYYPNTGLFVLP